MTHVIWGLTNSFSCPSEEVAQSRHPPGARPSFREGCSGLASGDITRVVLDYPQPLTTLGPSLQRFGCAARFVLSAICKGTAHSVQAVQGSIIPKSKAGPGASGQ